MWPGITRWPLMFWVFFSPQKLTFPNANSTGDLTIIGDPGAVSRVGRKGGTKVFKYVPFFATRLTAPGSPRMRPNLRWGVFVSIVPQTKEKKDRLIAAGYQRPGIIVVERPYVDVLHAVEPRHNEGPRDWQKMLAITRSFLFILVFGWGKENRSFYEDFVI